MPHKKHRRAIFRLFVYSKDDNSGVDVFVDTRIGGTLRERIRNHVVAEFAEELKVRGLQKMLCDVKMPFDGRFRPGFVRLASAVARKAKRAWALTRGA